MATRLLTRPLSNEIILPRPHTGQIIVQREARRFNRLIAGRRWRKTTLCMAICVEAAARGASMFWGSPTDAQARVAFKETKKAAGRVAHLLKSPDMLAEFPSGGSILFKSLHEPDNARGFTADGLVLDECADIPDEAWSIIRPILLDNPRSWAWLIGTPKPDTWFMRGFEASKGDVNSADWQAPTLGVEVLQDGTLVRKPHPLENPDISFDEVLAMYNDPEISRLMFMQEVMAVLTDEILGALWQQQWFDKHRATALPDFARVVVGVDPNVSDTENSDEMGIIAVGKTPNDHTYALGDYTCRGTTNDRARAAIMAFDEWKADCIVVEVNNGGDWIPAVIENVAKEMGIVVKVRTVHASRGKITRAEPIASRAEKGVSHIYKSLPKLEKECTTFVQGKKSPNRLDAFVWAETELITNVRKVLRAL